MYAEWIHKAVRVLERIVVALLIVMAALGIVEVALELYQAAIGPGFMPPDAVLKVLDAVLVVFVVIELVNIVFAYLNHEDVVSTVLEAGLVAVVRKLIVFDASASAEQILLKSGGLALLIVAIGIAWFLLRRCGVCTERPSK